MENQHIAYCGIDCSTCKLFLATKEDSDTLRAEVVREWSEKYKVAHNIEDMNCLGCKSDLVFKYCAQCDIRDCNMERGNAVCTQCADHRCDRIEQFYAHQEKEHPELYIVK